MAPTTCRNPPCTVALYLPSTAEKSVAVNKASETQPNKKGAKHTHTNKRVHETTTSDTEVAPAKRKKENAPEVQGMAETNKEPVPIPQRAQPTRPGRNEHPGDIVKPKRRRTTAQVAADKAAKEAGKKQQEELNEEKLQEYAQMEIDEEKRELDYEMNVIQRLSDLSQSAGGGTESELEEGDFEMDIDTSGSDDANPEPVTKRKLVSVSQYTP